MSVSNRIWLTSFYFIHIRSSLDTETLYQQLQQQMVHGAQHSVHQVILLDS